MDTFEKPQININVLTLWIITISLDDNHMAGQRQIEEMTFIYIYWSILASKTPALI